MSLFNNHPNLGHITTFGGHPVSCAGALGYLNVLKSENILQNVELKGKLFEKLLAHSSIVEIRRKGLFLLLKWKIKILLEE